MDYDLIKPDEGDAYDPAPFISFARRQRADKAERDPDVGDVVHYVDFGVAGCLPAVVLKEHFAYTEPTVDLLVHGHDRDFREREIDHDEGRGEGYWHWPCGGQ